MKVACVQFTPNHKDIEKNLDKIERLLRAAEPCDLFVLPELSLSGYSFATKEEALPFATPSTHWSITKLRSLSQEIDAAIVIGIIDQDDIGIYNTAILITRKGEIALKYRKVHLFYYEKVVFSPGDLGFPVAKIITSSGEQAKVGIQICYDWRFPEATRALTRAGAQVVAMPSNIVTTTGMLHETLRTRAFENKVIVAFADRIGTEALQTNPPEELVFRGESCIINYNGDILIKAITNETIISYDIHPNLTDSKSFNKFNDILTDRRPDQYQ